MARAIWSGSISFGLVNIPVRLFPAVNRRSVRFNQLHERTGARIRQQKVSAADGSEVSQSDIVRGYELAPESYVVVTDDELASLDPVVSRTIEVAEFVELSEIDPVYYDSAYYLAPDEVAAKAYALLARAMEREGKVALARFVMRTKQYLAAVRPKDGALVLSTMVYADEVNSIADLDGIDRVADIDVSDKELDMAAQLIESLSAPFSPEGYEDTYRIRLLELIERKAAGETELIAPAAAIEPEKVVDLMAALEASVAEAKASRKRHPTSVKAKKKAAPKKKATSKRKSA